MVCRSGPNSAKRSLVQELQASWSECSFCWQVSPCLLCCYSNLLLIVASYSPTCTYVSSTDQCTPPARTRLVDNWQPCAIRHLTLLQQAWHKSDTQAIVCKALMCWVQLSLVLSSDSEQCLDLYCSTRATQSAWPLAELHARCVHLQTQLTKLLLCAVTTNNSAIRQ